LVVAGDFNDGDAVVSRLLAPAGLRAYTVGRHPTFPSRLPLVQLDHVLARGMRPVGVTVPHGRNWWRMSDHLPLIAEFEWADAQ